MLPTKGYFQDIECPFNNTVCGRLYCHFRHKRKPNEPVEDNVQEPSKTVVPTYKPTPKSELANIHNNKSHIPISYVPDLAFKRERTVRPIRIDKPTYKPTPLSILSSATKPDSSPSEDHEHQETIKDIQENIASNVYDPQKSEINFEDLSTEFEVIAEIINDSEEPKDSINDNLIQLESDIEKEQNKLNLLQSGIDNSGEDSVVNDSKPLIKVEFSSDEGGQSVQETKLKEPVFPVHIKKEKPDKESLPKDKQSNKLIESKDQKNGTQGTSPQKDRPKSSDKSKSKDRSSSKEKNSKEKDVKKSEKSSKSHKSSEREKHRKEEKKNSSKNKETTKDKHRSKNKSRDRSRSPKEKKNEKKRSKNASCSDSGSCASSPERHRKEKKSDSSKTKKQREKSRSRSNKRDRKSKSSKSRSKSRSASREKSKHKSKKRSRSRTQHKDDEKKSSKNREDKEKSSSKSKDKNKDRDRTKAKISSSASKKPLDDKKDKKKKSVTDRKNSMSDNDKDTFHQESPPMDTVDLVPSDVDFDVEDDDETMRECFKIFSEYKPEPMRPQPKFEEVDKKNLLEEGDNLYHGKKRTAHAGAENFTSSSKLPIVVPPKPTVLPGQILTNRYRIAKMAQANNEQENIMNEVKSITQQTAKRPATSLLEAARQHKMKKLQQQKSAEAEKPNVNIVDDILNGVHRPSPSQAKGTPKKIAAVPNVALIEKAKQRISLVKQQRAQNLKTVAHSQKGSRVAHVPEYSLSDIPDVIQAEKSKLPVNVRTRFLTMIVEECSKLYALKEDAYNRALNEEFSCYEKCKVLATYRNSAMLAVNRLRKEIQERESKGLGPLLSGESVSNKKETDFEGRTFYDHVRKWVLNEEELDLHGYPRESGERGTAIINNRTEIDYSIVDENQRKCCRCSKIYQVDDDGWALFDEECMYHPLKKRTIRGEQIFLCCKSNDDTGCATSDTHVFDGLPKHLLEGYQTTLPPESDDDARSFQVYALDCEMCYTTKGLELTRVTIVDTACKTVYESFVKPLNPIIDYNTRFSGITKDQMDRTSTSILQVQANILHLCNSETILVGHSLESDMKALKIVHGTIIDTSVLFPHKMGLPHKRALRALASEYLKKIIQNDVAGHDSAEDAVACMDMIKWKLKEELKTRTK